MDRRFLAHQGTSAYFIHRPSAENRREPFSKRTGERRGGVVPPRNAAAGTAADF